ncbi:MAG: preprotein translocase subunit SecG [Acidobacteriota bacterium]
MFILVTIVHVIVCLILIGVVLLQSGKAADLAGAVGGMGSQTTFGPRAAATVLSKVTTAAAGLFMGSSLTLAVMATKGGGKAAGGSVLERTNVPAPPPQVQQAKPSQGPAVELVDEQGNVKKKFEVELPKEGAKDANGNPIPVKIGKEIQVDTKGNALPQKAPETKAPEKK